MSETTTIKLDELLVDPIFSPRHAQPVDEAYLARLVESLDDGETVPPLRVAPLGEPLRSEVSCKNVHTQQAIAGWQSRQARIPWANRPLAPELVLVDGLTRYHALRESGAKRSEVVVDAEPATTRVEVLVRAGDANQRNARALTDDDLRWLFAWLWLGREVKESHERWTPAAGALPGVDIADRLGRSEPWVSQMKSYVRVTYALGELGPDLGFRAAIEIARLPEDARVQFCFESDRPRLLQLCDELGRPRAEVALVTEMRVLDLRWLVDRALAQHEAVPPVPQAPVVPPPADEPEVDEHGQMLLDFEVDTITPLDNLRQIQAVRNQLPIEQLQTFYAYANMVMGEAAETVAKLEPLLKRAGVEV